MRWFLLLGLLCGCSSVPRFAEVEPTLLTQPAPRTAYIENGMRESLVRGVEDDGLVVRVLPLTQAYLEAQVIDQSVMEGKSWRKLKPQADAQVEKLARGAVCARVSLRARTSEAANPKHFAIGYLGKSKEAIPMELEGEPHQWVESSTDVSWIGKILFVSDSKVHYGAGTFCTRQEALDGGTFWINVRGRFAPNLKDHNLGWVVPGSNRNMERALDFPPKT